MEKSSPFSAPTPSGLRGRPLGTKGREYHAHHVAAELHGLRQRSAESARRCRLHVELGDSELDVVLLEPIETERLLSAEEPAVGAELAIAALSRPGGDVGMKPLSVLHHGREERKRSTPARSASMAAQMIARLGRHRDGAVRAILGAEAGEEQTNEMMDLRHRRYGALAAAARVALFDADGRWKSGDEVHVGAASCSTNCRA